MLNCFPQCGQIAEGNSHSSVCHDVIIRPGRHVTHTFNTEQQQFDSLNNAAVLFKANTSLLKIESH